MTAKTVAFRFRQHVRTAADGITCALYRAFKRYGVDAFSVECIVCARSKEEGIEIERLMIKQHRTLTRQHGYNMTAGGEGQSGVAPNAATREKLRIATTRRMADPAEREKVGAAWRGKKRSPEDRKKKSEAAKRAWANKEIREKQLFAMRASARTPRRLEHAMNSLAACAAGNKAAWADPVKRAARSAAISRAWAVRNNRQEQGK